LQRKLEDAEFIGHDELPSFDLPVIMVRSLLGAGDWEKGVLNFYRNEKLISALKKVKEPRLMVVQEKENLGNYDISGMDFHCPLPKDYNKVYAQNFEKYRIGSHACGYH